MKAFYPLKRSQPTNFVQPVCHYLEQNDSQQRSVAFRDIMSKITQLRNKVTALSYEQPTMQIVNKYIPAIEMYVRYALLMSKHLNWNKDYGAIVDDLKIVWYDSFNPQLKFMKNSINYDIFCCFYNLGIMYFYKAVTLGMEQLHTDKKESMKCAKTAYYLFNRMRTVYYADFVNTAFSDTDYSHLQLLESFCQGIFYKNLFNIFKQDEYKLGIDKIAALAGLAKQHFYHANQIATAYFMKSSNIKPLIKKQILSLSYIESLYHDLMFNTRLAKYYSQQMDNNKDNIVNLIAYQRKALRFLQLGLNNPDVAQLINDRPEQKKQLLNIKPVIQSELKNNLKRNQEIYKKAQIKEQQLPPPKDPPQNYIIKLEQPQSIKPNYQGAIAGPFAQLVDNQSKGFMNQLKDLARNRLSGLQSAYTKISKNIQTIYNDNFVNYYANLQNNSKNKSFPQNLRQKIQQIQLNGGKQKLQLQVKILKKNSQQALDRLKGLKQMLAEQQSIFINKSQQYGPKWRIQPSNQLNRSYFGQIQTYQIKCQTANNVNKKIIQKFQSLSKYINVVDGNQQTISSVLPKIQVTKFIQQNKAQFQNMKKGMQSVKNRKQGLDSIVDQLKRFFQKMNFSEVASKYYSKIDAGNRQKILQQIFGSCYKLIQSFNQKAVTLQKQSKVVGDIASDLNKKNKGDQKSKKEYEDVVSKFNQINNLYRDLGQGTAFYAKLGDVLVKLGENIQGYVSARKIQAQQLQASLNRGGGNPGNNLPMMYPNQPQQNLGFYVPPPMNFGNQGNQGFGFQGGQGFGNNNNNNMEDLLNNIMRSKPSFGGDIFKSPVFQSKYN